MFRFTFLFSHYFDCSVMNSLYRCLSIVLDFDDVVNKFIFRIKFHVNASAQARNAIRSMRETKDENMRGGPFALWPFFRSVKHFVLLFARDNCVWIPIISCVCNFQHTLFIHFHARTEKYLQHLSRYYCVCLVGKTLNWSWLTIFV